jgi:nucleoside-diphosphate-sugar epimerase
LELAEQIMQRTGNQVPLVFQPEGQDNRNYIIDSSRFLAEVGPFEHIGIFQGLEKTIHHRRNV